MSKAASAPKKVVEGEDNSSDDDNVTAAHKAAPAAAAVGKRKLATIRRPIVSAASKTAKKADNSDEDEGATVGAPAPVAAPAAAAVTSGRSTPSSSRPLSMGAADTPVTIDDGASADNNHHNATGSPTTVSPQQGSFAAATESSAPVPLSSAAGAGASASDDGTSPAASPSSFGSGAGKPGGRVRLGTGGDRAASTWAAKRRGGGMGRMGGGGLGDDEDSFGDALPGTSPTPRLGGLMSNATASPPLAEVAPSPATTTAAAAATSASPSPTAGRRGTITSLPASPSSPSKHVPTAMAKYDYESSVAKLINTMSGVSNLPPPPAAAPQQQQQPLGTKPSAASSSSATTAGKIHVAMNADITAQDVRDAAAKATSAAKAYFGQIAGAVGNTKVTEGSSKPASSGPATTSSGSLDSSAGRKPKIQELLARPIVRIVDLSAEAAAAAAEGTATVAPSTAASVYEPPTQRFAALHNAATRLSYATAQHLYDTCLAKNIIAPLAANTHKTEQHARQSAATLREATVDANAMASLILTMPIWF